MYFFSSVTQPFSESSLPVVSTEGLCFQINKILRKIALIREALVSKELIDEAFMNKVLIWLLAFGTDLNRVEQFHE